MLSVKSLNVGYGDVQVVWDVSFEVKEQELVALIGSNGAGKTTTIKTISGLMQPFNGSITFKGEELVGRKCPEITKLGLSQIPEGRQIFAGMSVRENLEMGGYILKSTEIVEKNLQRMYEIFPRLKEREKQTAGTLSGGEQQMLAIGRGLMSNPSLLILDEPSLGLAPNLVDMIFEVIKQLREEQGLTVVLVEQDVNKALSIADRGYVFENGKVVHEGTSTELSSDMDIKKMYLGL